MPHAIYPKFPVIEPDEAVKAHIQQKPTPTPATMDLRADLIQEVERVTGEQVPEKCRKCKKLPVCVILSTIDNRASKDTR